MTGPGRVMCGTAHPACVGWLHVSNPSLTLSAWPPAHPPACLPARLPACLPTRPPPCPPRICFRPRPAIVDLSPSTRLAQRVVEGVVTTLEDERDAVLYYLLARHPGRALVSLRLRGSGFAPQIFFLYLRTETKNADPQTLKPRSGHRRCAWCVEGSAVLQFSHAPVALTLSCL